MKSNVHINRIYPGASQIFSSNEDGSPKISSTMLAAAGVLLTLPCTQLFTLYIGFPLKIYELCISLWIVLSFVTLRLIIFDKRIFLRGLSFFLYTIIALFIIIIFYRKAPYTDLARFTPLMDGLLKGGYVLLCVMGFNLVAYTVLRAPNFMIRLWLWGAVFSAIVHLYLTGISALGHPIPGLPGMRFPVNQQVLDFHGLHIFRAGTFLEGNYAGPFFVLSFLIAITVRRFWLSLLFLAAIVASFSTTACLALAICIGYVLWKNRHGITRLYLTLVILVFILAGAPILNSIVFEKFTDTRKEASIIERQATFMNAWQMFLNYPVLGVGAAQYGMYMDAGQDWIIIESQNRSVATGIWRKTIPNSIYAEVLCEYGLIGAGFFILFLFSILRLVWQCPFPALRAGAIAIPIFWIAGQGKLPYEQHCKNTYTQENIHFLGFVQPEELFKKIQVLIVPSLWHEPLPRTIFEAYAHGMPIIGSKRGGISEIVEEGKTGFLFEPDNENELENILANLNPQKCLAMQAACVEKAKAFLPDPIVNQYLEVYQKILAL